MDDPSNAGGPPHAMRAAPAAYCGLRTCGMHPEHLHSDDAGRAVGCPGSHPC